MRKFNSLSALYVFVSVHWWIQNAGGQVPGVPVPVPPLPEPVAGPAKPAQPTLDQLAGKKPGTPTPAPATATGAPSAPAPPPPSPDSAASGSGDKDAKNGSSTNGTGNSSANATAIWEAEHPKPPDFLGIEPVEVTEVKLKKSKPGSFLPEPNCGRTYYMGPFSRPVVFTANGSIQLRNSTFCDWGFIGTEPCIPLLICQHFNLINTNETCEEYMEIYDGRRGKLKFCGGNGPIGISANGDLRDLYVKYVTIKKNSTGDPEQNITLKFNCTVTCSQRGDGYELPNTFEPLIDTDCFCGLKANQNRIVNGEEVIRKEFPWMVALVRKNTRQPFCGGALINDRTIISAAHCLQGPFLNIDNVEVVLGAHVMDKYPNPKIFSKTRAPTYYDENTLAQLDTQNGTFRVGLNEMIVHPLFVEETRDFDVALLMLSAPLDFSVLKTISPVCLPKTGSYLRTFSNYSAVVTGWGFPFHDSHFSSSRLQKLSVDVIAPKSCKAMFPHSVNRRMMCAGAKNKSQSVCYGDAGGPLITDDKPQVWYHIGLLIGGDACTETAKSAIYFRTTEIGQWTHYHSNRNEAVWCSIPKPPKPTT